MFYCHFSYVVLLDLFFFNNDNVSFIPFICLDNIRWTFGGSAQPWDENGLVVNPSTVFVAVSLFWELDAIWTPCNCIFVYEWPALLYLLLNEGSDQQRVNSLLLWEEHNTSCWVKWRVCVCQRVRNSSVCYIKPKKKLTNRLFSFKIRYIFYLFVPCSRVFYHDIFHSPSSSLWNTKTP